MTRWPPRRPVPSVDAPEPLCRYVPHEWPSCDPLADWRRACLAWLAADRSRRLPFGEHGDQVDVLRESARVKLRAGTP
jgi:hypothetical protein